MTRKTDHPSNIASDGETALGVEIAALKHELSNARDTIARLEKMADEDPLIKVLNRRAFERELERALAYIARYGTIAAMVFIDLDDFKSINDQYDHRTGDMALRHVGEMFSAHVRKSDIVGRLGGDEFGLVLNQVGVDQALEKAHGLCRLIADTPFIFNGRAIDLKVSAGVAALDCEVSAAEIIARADEAMYAQKSRARQA